MADADRARFRMRYSFESRLRAVRLVAAGMNMAEAARRQGAAAARPLAPGAVAGAAGRTLRAGTGGRTAARRHQESGPLLVARQGDAGGGAAHA